MIPRTNSSFYKLPDKLKALYMTGMPLEYLDDRNKEFQFKNEKNGPTKVLSATQQDKCFKQFLEAPFGDQNFIIFNSAPTDQEALRCCTTLLKKKHAEGFHDFEFVHPAEPIPYTGTIKKLYVLQGCHEKDPALSEIPYQVRKWVRTPLGASIWLILTSKEPISWTRESLGIVPDYLFSLKTATQSVG
jgi:hypothetical protein